MLNGATLNAAAIVGTAVFNMVVSNDSMKNATATSHGSKALLVLPGVSGEEDCALEWIALMSVSCRPWVQEQVQFILGP